MALKSYVLFFKRNHIPSLSFILWKFFLSSDTLRLPRRPPRQPARSTVDGGSKKLRIRAVRFVNRLWLWDRREPWQSVCGERVWALVLCTLKQHDQFVINRFVKTSLIAQCLGALDIGKTIELTTLLPTPPGVAFLFRIHCCSLIRIAGRYE